MTAARMTAVSEATLKRIKLLLGDKAPSDELLELYSEMALQRILNYINRAAMPDALILDVFIPTVIAMATGKDGSTSGTMEVKPEVASVSEAGRSVSFKAENATVATAMLETKMIFYMDQLNKHRKIL